MSPDPIRVPPAVVEYCRSSRFRDKFTPTEIEAFSRLLSDINLAAVWAELVRPERPETDLPLFVDRCVSLQKRWLTLSREPSKRLERRFERLAARADLLASELRASSAELGLQGTPLNLRQLFLKCSVIASIAPFDGGLDFPDSEEFERCGRREVLDPTEPYDGIQVRRVEDMAATHVLDALSISLRARAQAPIYDVRPTKLNLATESNRENPQRTFFARALTHFFLTHGGSPKYGLVALSVTALMDLSDPLEESHVRHICSDLEGRYGDPTGEEWLDVC